MVLFEIHQRFKGHFLNELRVSFKVKPISNILKLIKQRNILYWKSGNPDIKQDTLCKDYENGGLKDVDITFNILSLQCSWVKSLDDSSTQELGKENIFYFTLTYS